MALQRGGYSSCPLSHTHAHIYSKEIYTVRYRWKIHQTAVKELITVATDLCPTTEEGASKNPGARGHRVELLES